MTIREIIEHIDENKPNAYSDKQKLHWIALLDGKIAADLMMMAPEEIRNLFDYKYPEDMEREPLITFPHDDIYPAWLECKIDREDHEDSRYQNSVAVYNAIWEDFACWFLNNYDPAQYGR